MPSSGVSSCCSNERDDEIEQRVAVRLAGVVAELGGIGEVRDEDANVALRDVPAEQLVELVDAHGRRKERDRRDVQALLDGARAEVAVRDRAGRVADQVQANARQLRAHLFEQAE